MKRFLLGNWQLVCLFFVIVLFFSKLFFPPSIFINPDYGRSDLVHFNIPLRILLSESLKNFTLPLWETKIGQGYPIFAEGQIGFFYLPNIILFSSLPFWLAFNLSYVITTIIAAFGTYLLARSFGADKIASTLAAATYAFSSFFMFHVHHFNLLQSASTIPWLFWLVNSFTNTKKLLFLAIIPFILSQNIFAGFPQLTFYGLVGLTIFSVSRIFSFKSFRLRVKMFLLFVLAVLLGITISAIQILGTRQLANQAQRLEIPPSKILSEFPFRPKDFLTLIDPFVLGSVSDGTAEHWRPNSQAPFWERNTYFGVVQLILISGFGIATLKKNPGGSRKKLILFWYGLGTLGVLLALGSSSLLHPVFSFWPFSLFRVPARFLILSFLSASVLVAFAASRIPQLTPKTLTKFLPVAILLLAFADIFRNYLDYNLTGQKDKWLTAPELAKYVNPGERIVALQQTEIWNDRFVNKGWKNQEPQYYFLKNSLSQNSNVISGLDNTLAYAAMLPRRNQLIEILLAQNIKKENGQSAISEAGQKLLNFTSTQYLTSPSPLTSDGIEEIANARLDENIIHLYRNKEALPRAFLVSDFAIAKNLPEVNAVLTSPQYNPQKTVILEKQPELEPYERPEGYAAINYYGQTKVSIDVSLKNPAILILTDSFYPGWQAEINSQKKEIMAANINSRAVIVPAGNNYVEFKYKPDYIKSGSIISASALLISIFLLFFAVRKTVSL